MTVTTRDAGPAPGLAGEDLARAILAGLEMRRFGALEEKAQLTRAVPADIQPLPALPEATLPGVRPLLEPYANTLGHPASARPGWFGKVLRQTRRALKALLRPWFELQTRFNHSTIDTLESSNRALQGHLQQLTARLHAQSQMLSALSQSLDERTRDLQGRQGTLETRIEDCFDSLHHCREMLAARIDRYCHGTMPRLDSAVLIEQVFVHSRLPAPPARILNLSRAEHASAAEINNLGYQLTQVDPGWEQQNSPLPFDNECFDGLIMLHAFANPRKETGAEAQHLVAEATRVLCRRGRLLFTVRFSPSADKHLYWVYDRAELAKVLRPLRLVEQAFGVWQHGAWSFSTDERAVSIDSDEQPPTVVLVHAEKG
jgi:hypothetical protein